ncbi:17809_t:CDS:10, partial [Gigaspora margarita]
RLSQINKLFGTNAETINELPQINLVATIDIILYQEQLNFTVQNIKMIKKTSIAINYANEVESKGRFDFTIIQNEDILLVAEIKVADIEYGLCQNLVQIQSACQSNKKRKHASLEYVYGIVTTGEKWYFSVVTSENKIGATKDPLYLHLNAANEERLEIFGSTNNGVVLGDLWILNANTYEWSTGNILNPIPGLTIINRIRTVKNDDYSTNIGIKINTVIVLAASFAIKPAKSPDNIGLYVDGFTHQYNSSNVGRLTIIIGERVLLEGSKRLNAIKIVEAGIVETDKDLLRRE